MGSMYPIRRFGVPPKNALKLDIMVESGKTTTLPFPYFKATTWFISPHTVFVICVGSLDLVSLKNNEIK